LSLERDLPFDSRFSRDELLDLTPFSKGFRSGEVLNPSFERFGSGERLLLFILSFERLRSREGLIPCVELSCSGERLLTDVFSSDCSFFSAVFLDLTFPSERRISLGRLLDLLIPFDSTPSLEILLFFGLFFSSGCFGSFNVMLFIVVSFECFSSEDLELG